MEERSMHSKCEIGTHECGCLPPDRLWKVAFALGTWLKHEVIHLHSCPVCRRRFTEVLKAQQSANQEATVARFVLGILSLVALHKLSRPTAVGTASTEMLSCCEEPLTFEDPALQGTLYSNQGKYWLDISHSILPIGTLLRVRLGEGESARSYFAVLGVGFSDPIASIPIDEALGEQPASLAIDFIPSATELTEQDAAVLRDAVTLASQDETTLAAWRTWAAGEQNQPGVPAGVRAIIDKILNQEGATHNS